MAFRLAGVLRSFSRNPRVPLHRQKLCWSSVILSRAMVRARFLLRVTWSGKLCEFKRYNKAFWTTFNLPVRPHSLYFLYQQYAFFQLAAVVFCQEIITAVMLQCLSFFFKPMIYCSFHFSFISTDFNSSSPLNFVSMPSIEFLLVNCLNLHQDAVPLK